MNQPRDPGLKMKFVDFTHVNVMLGNKVLPDGRGILKDNAVALLTQFAAAHGPTIVQTEQLDGRVERDIIHSDGTVEPYYSVQSTTEQVELPLNNSLVESLQRAVATGTVDDSQEAKHEPQMQPVIQTLDWIDVEGEIAKFASAESSSQPGKREKKSSGQTSKPHKKLVLFSVIGAAAFTVAAFIFLL